MMILIMRAITRVGSYLLAAGINFGNTTILMPIAEVDVVLAEIERFKIP